MCCIDPQVTVAPGKVDEVLPLVKALVDYANSDAEPDVLVYRSSRFEEVREIGPVLA